MLLLVLMKEWEVVVIARLNFPLTIGANLLLHLHLHLLFLMLHHPFSTIAMIYLG